MSDSKIFLKADKRIAHMLLVVSVLATACLIVFTGSASAGIVTSGAGDPIEGALVKLVDYPQYNDTTDVNGNYTINNVPYGTYTISASAAGYGTNVSTVTVDGAVIKDFTLSGSSTYESVFLINGWGYDSAIHARNPQDVDANVTIEIYYSNGTFAGSNNYVIAPNASIAYFIPDIIGFNVDSAYSARTTSNVPIVLTSDIRSLATSILSSVPGQIVMPSTTQYSGFLISDSANNVDSAIHIRNPQATSVNTTVEIYYSNGTLAGSKIYAIAPNAMVADFTSTILGNSDYFKGSVKFISTAPVVSTADIRSISTGVLASIPGQEVSASTSQNSVFLLSGWGFDSYVQFVNPQSTSNDVTVELYYTNGSLAATQLYTLQPSESVDMHVIDFVADSTFVGSAKVSATQPIVEQSSIMSISNNVYASVVGQMPASKLNGIWTLNGWGYDSAVHMLNPQSTNATVTVHLLNNDGSLAASKAYVIQANSMAAYFTTDVLGSGGDFAGSVLFEADKPVIITNDIRALAAGVLTSQPGISV